MKALHKTLDILRLGFSSLLAHKVRSMLTATGIIFGVWSVIAMLAISEGASYESQLALRQLGSDNIIVESVKPSEESGERRWGFLEYGLTRADSVRLRGNLPGLRRLVPVHQTPRLAYAGGRRDTQVVVMATEPAYAEVARVKMTAGRFFSAADMEKYKEYCVITLALARSLFGRDDPVGETMRLTGEPFQVIGVVERVSVSTGGGSAGPEMCVIIPSTTERSQYGLYTVLYSQGASTRERVAISQAILQMEDEQAVVNCAPLVRELLTRYHPKQDFRVMVPLELIEQKRKQMEIWNFVFLAIASVSLLVGGIGIMNIMLASVTERTREVGIRRALGAKRRDIVTQFLVEAVTLTTVGGLIGIGAGMLVPYLIEKTLNRVTIVSVWTLLVPLFMAIVVGLASGLYPALRAARLNPIAALRHE